MSATIAASVAALRDAYPRQEFPDRSVQMYVRMLADADPAELEAAVARLVRRTPFIPAISEILAEVAEAKCGLPTAAEAWTLACSDEPLPNLPVPVIEAIQSCGGRWTIRHSEQPTVVRAQFTRDYQQRRDRQILITADAAVLSEVVARELAAIPPTDSAVPRPVWARWLRRQEPGDEILMPPTDAEMHDAVAVLEADAWGVAALHAEAQRILDEANTAIHGFYAA